MPRVTITAPDKNAQPYRLQLDRQVVTLGRGCENDIVIDCGSVSTHHAEMRRVEGGYELCDIGSTNGIKLDGVRHTLVPLHSGMTLKIGDVTFEFQLSDEESEVLAHERPPEAVLPTPAAEKRPPQRASYAPAATGGGGSGTTLLFLVLAAAAFFAGLAVRYQKETGGSLIQSIQAKAAVKTTAPAK